MNETFDGNGFVTELEDQLGPMAEISVHIIAKQMRDLAIDRENMTPAQAEQLVGRIDIAMSSFFGEKGAVLMKNIMMKTLRKYAREYLDDKYGI